MGRTFVRVIIKILRFDQSLINCNILKFQIRFSCTLIRHFGQHNCFHECLMIDYRKVASSNTSCLEPHPGFFILLMKGKFDGYVLGPFGKKFIF